ncbi:MAG: S41 family peptidase [Candidatus Bipolaricaulota bacterium]
MHIWIIVALSWITLLSSRLNVVHEVSGAASAEVMAQDLSRTVAESRTTSWPSVSPPESLLYDYTSFGDPGVTSRIVATDKPSPAWITREQAREDIRFLFEMLKYGYALYQLFGGDETFDGARTDLLDEVASMGSESRIRVSALRDRILHHLAFIQDGHAKFAGTPLYQRQYWFRNDRYEFARDAEGFYVLRQPLTSLGDALNTLAGRVSLVAVDGRAPEELLSLSLDERGRLIYILSVLSARPETRIRTELTLTVSGQTFGRSAVLTRQSGTWWTETMRDLRFPASTAYAMSVVRGVPIVINRSGVPSSPEAVAALRRMVDEASRCAEYPVAILDLRNHEGGQAEYGRAWTEEFMGRAFACDTRWAELHTPTSLRLHRCFVEDYLAAHETQLREVLAYLDATIEDLEMHRRTAANAWVLAGEMDDEPEALPNDTTLFVLIDAETGSAGEEFVNALRQFENVILVGENTEGLTVSGSPAWGRLPNSRLPFVLAIGITLKDIEAGREGIGIPPDLWVDPAHALERVLAYIEATDP